MIDVAVTVAEGWPADDAEWEALAARAVGAAVAVTPYRAIADAAVCYEVAVRLTDDAEVHTLNADWRGKDRPTNVLSFPQVEPAMIGQTVAMEGAEILLGDIVLARETCLREAAEKAMAPSEYVCHLVVHATLHLLGYDHEDDEAASAMEDLERQAMGGMGFADPYRTDGACSDGGMH